MDSILNWQSATPIPNLAKRNKDPEWERKQRAREYRVAARREKRNRKADEKKQRKLNATILRRMTRNPDKYTKNSERNRLRAIESERRAIWREALKQVQRLAAVHDPTGAMFNVGPVTIQEDGAVISAEAMRCQEERKARTLPGVEGDTGIDNETMLETGYHVEPVVNTGEQAKPDDRIHPNRVAHVSVPKVPSGKPMSKTQQKRLAALQPRPPPPKPVIPPGVTLPEGEEDWLALWDLSDDGLERRVLRAKKRKAAARKALRVKQQSGKVERRAARDEKRRVYRELKMTWKLIKEVEKRHKTTLKSAEDEGAKKIAVEIAAHERRVALECCASLGFTLANTPGMEAIQPRLLGTKGQMVDFEALELGESATDIRPSTGSDRAPPQKRRVDLSAISQYDSTYVTPLTENNASEHHEFIKLDIGEGQDFQALEYNHKLRRKIRRAIDAAEIRKELLVRERTRLHCEENNIAVPSEICTTAKPVHERGQRVLENGLLESAKNERVRNRIELAEFNKAARVLRKQAKSLAMEAGLRVYAEMTGKLLPKELEEKSAGYGEGWHAVEDQNFADILKAEDITVL